MNLENKKKFIIFDLDGTLINSLPDIANAINYTLKKKGYQQLSIDDVSTMIGNGVSLLIERALKEVKEEEPTHDEIEDTMNMYFGYYKDHVCVDTYLYPHVRETLALLDDAGYEMAICTNKPYDFVEPILEKLNIKPYFKTWIGEKSLEVKKPDPGPLFFLMDKFNYTKDESIMVGDSKNDILAAQNAAIDSIGVSYGYNYNENIADYNPTHVVSDFGKIREALSKYSA